MIQSIHNLFHIILIKISNTIMSSGQLEIECYWKSFKKIKIKIHNNFIIKKIKIKYVNRVKVKNRHILYFYIFIFLLKLLIF
jgi:hypothetical protein